MVRKRRGMSDSHIIVARPMTKSPTDHGQCDECAWTPRILPLPAPGPGECAEAGACGCSLADGRGGASARACPWHQACGTEGGQRRAPPRAIAARRRLSLDGRDWLSGALAVGWATREV